ncbi:hypothetical protein QYF36_025128 [Acer negundo]|nr:hypothetical protein QYF36_025128 [Acer negundo]
MIAACLFPPLTADRKRLAGAAPPSDESGDEGSKDDAPQYTLEDLAGGAPRYTPEEDLGHYEVGTSKRDNLSETKDPARGYRDEQGECSWNELSGQNDTFAGEAVALVDEAAAPTDEGPTPEDEETVRGRKEEFAEEQAIREIIDFIRPVITLTIRVEVEVKDPAADLDTLKTMVLMLELAGRDNVFH